MNVTCTKCGKKYVIADDKVAGKSAVKIRCKQCQNLIAVAIAPPSSPSGVRAMSAGAPPPPTDSEAPTPIVLPTGGVPSWFAMIGGKQEGPFDLVTLQGRVNRAEVTLRTYLWKAGMSDWKRAADVPEVSGLFAGTSAGATATGPTQGSSHSPSGVRARVHRDVALANETPSPEFTRRSSPAVASSPSAASRPSHDSLAEIVASSVEDAGAPSEEASSKPTAPLPSLEEPTVAEAAHDPFAQLPHQAGEVPPPGEATKFFIARAGVHRRNPPWKVALFAAAAVGVPAAITFLLSSLKVVDLPTVTRTTEDGREVQETFFSPGGMTGLRDLLTGDAEKKKDQAARARAAARETAVARAAPPEPARESEPSQPARPKTSNAALAALYGKDELQARGPRVRKDEAEAPAAGPQVNAAGLSQAAAMKIVGDKAKAFQQCVETALHRNPNLSVGNILVVLTVGPSGAVKAASVEPRKHEATDWAQCMVAAGKRIVFPASDSETQLELPFKVGVAIGP